MTAGKLKTFGIKQCRKFADDITVAEVKSFGKKLCQTITDSYESQEIIAVGKFKAFENSYVGQLFAKRLEFSDCSHISRLDKYSRVLHHSHSPVLLFALS